MNDELAVVTVGYYGISWLADAYYHQLHKYFGKTKSYLLADQDYGQTEPIIFKKADSTVNNEWHRSNFISDFKLFIARLDENFMLLNLMDYLLLGQANLKPINDIIELMSDNPNILRVDIANDYAIYGTNCCNRTKYKSIHVFECPPENRNCFYPGSLAPAIWNISLLHELLPSDGDPWQFEKFLETAFLNNLSVRSVAVAPEIFQYVNACRARDADNIVIPSIIWDDVKSLLPARFANTTQLIDKPLVLFPEILNDMV